MRCGSKRITRRYRYALARSTGARPWNFICVLRIRRICGGISKITSVIQSNRRLRSRRKSSGRWWNGALPCSTLYSRPRNYAKSGVARRNRSLNCKSKSSPPIRRSRGNSLRPTAEAHPLGLAARSFVRVPQSAAIDTPPIPGPASEGTLRVLLVICRPEGSADVPFRAVASRIVETLDIGACDVLRPPTLENLSETLAARRKAGRPYDVVHFDGHGVFLDLKAEQMGVHSDPTRMRGYLVFETGDGGSEYVNGSVIGQILQENQTPILVLNACRSARAQPRPAAAQNASVQPLVFQSLSQEAMSFRLSGIVAMRFNVYVLRPPASWNGSTEVSRPANCWETLSQMPAVVWTRARFRIGSCLKFWKDSSGGKREMQPGRRRRSFGQHPNQCLPAPVFGARRRPAPPGPGI